MKLSQSDLLPKCSNAKIETVAISRKEISRNMRKMKERIDYIHAKVYFYKAFRRFVLYTYIYIFIYRVSLKGQNHISEVFRGVLYTIEQLFNKGPPAMR